MKVWDPVFRVVSDGGALTVATCYPVFQIYRPACFDFSDIHFYNVTYLSSTHSWLARTLDFITGVLVSLDLNSSRRQQRSMYTY